MRMTGDDDIRDVGGGVGGCHYCRCQEGGETAE